MQCLRKEFEVCYLPPIHREGVKLFIRLRRWLVICNLNSRNYTFFVKSPIVYTTRKAWVVMLADLIMFATDGNIPESFTTHWNESGVLQSAMACD